jgi:hypothetical protein
MGIPEIDWPGLCRFDCAAVLAPARLAEVVAIVLSKQFLYVKITTSLLTPLLLWEPNNQTSSRVSRGQPVSRTRDGKEISSPAAASQATSDAQGGEIIVVGDVCLDSSDPLGALLRGVGLHQEIVLAVVRDHEDLALVDHARVLLHDLSVVQV